MAGLVICAQAVLPALHKKRAARAAFALPLLVLGCHVFVAARGGNLVGANFRCSGDERLEKLDHLRIRVLGVRVELCFVVPQRDSDGLIVLSEHGDLIAEAIRLAKEGKDFFLELRGHFLHMIRLHAECYVASKHMWSSFSWGSKSCGSPDTDLAQDHD